jgi:DNA-binding transcriptional regulator GbsR (MarR family)
MDDPLEMFRIVGSERKRREMDPTVAILAECLEEQKNARKADLHTEKRLSDMKEFFDSSSACFDKLNSLPTSTLRKLSKMGDKLLKLLSI